MTDEAHIASGRKRLVDALRALDPDEHAPLKKWLATLGPDDMEKTLFQNPKRLLLTRTAVKALSMIFDFWKIDIEHKLTARQHLRLARASRLPYFVCDTYIVTFEREIGFFLNMIRGSIDRMDEVLPN